MENEDQGKYPGVTQRQRKELSEMWEAVKDGSSTFAKEVEKRGKAKSWFPSVRKKKPWLFEELGIPLDTTAGGLLPPRARISTGTQTPKRKYQRREIAPYQETEPPAPTTYQRIDIRVPDTQQPSNETLVVLMGRAQDVQTSLDAIARIYGR